MNRYGDLFLRSLECDDGWLFRICYFKKYFDPVSPNQKSVWANFVF